jgi:restriction system protein
VIKRTDAKGGDGKAEGGGSPVSWTAASIPQSRDSVVRRSICMVAAFRSGSIPMARRNKNEFFELFHGLFMRIPAWACFPIAIAAYGIITALVMAVASAGPATRALAGVAPIASFGAAGLILLAGLKAAVEKRTRRAILAKQTGIESIRQLSWSSFELLVGEAYRRQGYAVEETGGGGADGGIDLKLRRNGALILMQCKHWKTWKVSVPSIREFYGVLMSERADRAIFITSGVLTANARRFAQGKPLELIDGDELVSLIRPADSSAVQPLSEFRCAPKAPKTEEAAEGRRLLGEPLPVTVSPIRPPTQSPTSAPSCPKCSSSMVLRTARRGTKAGSQFWGCSTYPACKGIREA